MKTCFMIKNTEIIGVKSFRKIRRIVDPAGRELLNPSITESLI